MHSSYVVEKGLSHRKKDALWDRITALLRIAKETILIQGVLIKEKPGQTCPSLKLDRYLNNFGYYLLKGYLLFPTVPRNVGFSHQLMNSSTLTRSRQFDFIPNPFNLTANDCAKHTVVQTKIFNLSLKCLCSLTDITEPTFLVPLERGDSPLTDNAQKYSNACQV